MCRRGTHRWQSQRRVAGHRCDHAIGETAGAAASLVEQARRQHGIGGQKGFGIREDLPRDGFSRRIQRPAQKFRPGNAAGVTVFLRLRPAPEFFMRRRASDDGLDEKVGVEMNHAESFRHHRLASRADAIHSAALAASRRRCFCSDSKAYSGEMAARFTASDWKMVSRPVAFSGRASAPFGRTCP